MKKTLVALAALAAFGAQAQSSVTITGTFDPTYQIGKTTFADGSTRRATEMVTSNVGTSGVTFAGTEDIGGGLKGMFLYEMNFDASATTASPTAGQVFAGLSNSMGSIKLGAPNTPSLTTQSSRSGFGSKIGGGRSGLGLSGASRTRNSDSILLESAEFSGLKASFAYVAKATAGANTVLGTGAVTAAEEITDIGVFYTQGPIAAGLSQYAQNGAVKHTTAFASYTMGSLKVMAGMHNNNNKKAVSDTVGDATTAAKYAAAVGKTKGTNIAVNYTIGAATVLANVARVNDTTTTDRDLKMTAVGVNYALSKRTQLTARMINEKRDNAGAQAYVAKDVKTTLIGVQHNF